MTDTDFPGFPAVLGQLARGETLPAPIARSAMDQILGGHATPAQIAAFLMGLVVRGETAGEVSAFVDSMLAAATPLVIDNPNTIDIVGTGGSPRRRTRALNVSTGASLVAAAAGVSVCKHGNRRASSTSGSTDVLEALGLNVELDADGVRRVLSEVGVAFAFARMFHPAMRFAGPVRTEMGIPTVFNLLGPLSHPGRVRRAVVGVGDAARFDLVADTLATRELDNVWVVHGTDGIDELSTSAESRVCVIAGAQRSEFEVAPEDFGMDRVDADDLRGGDPAANAAVLVEVLGGTESREADLICLNAAAGLVAAGSADDLGSALTTVRDALARGEGMRVLAHLRESTTR